MDQTRVLSPEQNEMLCEVHNHGELILTILKSHLKHTEFSASKYKEQECYEELTRSKRAFNILKTFLTITK
jgi:hypothetical protein